MRIFAAALLLSLLAPSSSVLAGEERPSGANCNLTKPPAEAGEELSHGATLRIFPRAKTIDASYSGCQTLWAPKQNGWSEVIVVAIVKGDPVRIWSKEKSDSERFACIYERGRVVSGNASSCAAAEFLILKSLAPGCVAMVKNAVAAGGLGAEAPQGCEYE